MFGTRKTTGIPDERVRKALEVLRVKYFTDNEGDFHVVFELDEGRTQKCIIRSATYEFLGIEIREVTSAALLSHGPFDARTANILLQQNEQVKLGAWGVMNNDEDTYAALFTAKISADLPPKELLGVVGAVLKTADAMELRLSGRDDF